MKLLTDNEKKVLRLLASSGKNYSINDIAKKCLLSPNGAYKILKKMEAHSVLKVKPIANIRSYELDFENEKTAKVLEMAFMTDRFEGRIKLREEDLRSMKKVTKVCILFGSYVTSKKKPSDLDVLFLLEKTGFKAYKDNLEKVQNIIPVKIHDIIQTIKDLEDNLRKQDKIVVEALSSGIVLWGSSVIIEAIKNVKK